MAPAMCSESISLQTSRLLLRGAIPSDAGPLYHAFSDPEVMAYWSSLPHTEPVQTSNWIDHMIANPQNGVTDFIIVETATSTPIGKIGIWSGNEIGFLISRSHWRRGLVSEALETLFPYYFGLEDGGEGGKRFASIVADVDPRNEASIGLLRKFGFREMGRREKTYLIGEQWVDSVDLKLQREDWEREHGQARTLRTTPSQIHVEKSISEISKLKPHQVQRPSITAG